MDNQLLFSELCTKILANEASPSERIQFEALLQSETNKKQFEQLEMIWNNVPDAEVIHTNANDAWNKISSRIQAATAPVDNARPVAFKVKRNFSIAKIAASVALLVLSSVVIYYWVKPGQPHFESFVSGNKIEQLQLKDGSSVRAGENSKIEYATDFKNNRLVKLSGSAFFKVMRDSLHPFVVESKNVKITVLGTAFSVENLKDQRTRVFVEHGKVSVISSSQHEVLLTNGMSVIIDAGGEIDATAADDVDAELTGVKKFNNASLKEILAYLEQQFKINISAQQGINTAETLTIPVNCNNQKPEEILEVLTLSLGLKYEKQGNNYQLILP